MTKRISLGVAAAGLMAIAGLAAAAPAQAAPTSDSPVVFDQVSTTGPDWIKLRNVSSGAVHLGGYDIRLETTAGGTFNLPSGAYLEPSGTFLITSQNDTSPCMPDMFVGPDVPSNGRGTLKLLADGAVVDSVQLPINQARTCH